jgi:hypothetical protein
MALATACGSSSKPKASPSSTAVESTTTVAKNVSDKATARTIALRLSDFPSGWTSTPHRESSSEGKNIDRQLSECLGLPADKLIPDSQSADSPDFQTGKRLDEQEVQNSIGIASEADVAKAFDVLGSDKLPQCFRDAIETSLKQQQGLENATVGTPKIEPLSVGDFGEKTIAYRITINVEVQGIALDVYVDFVLIKVGRVGIFLSTQTLSNPFDDDLRTQLLNAVVDRAKAAA